MTVLLLIRHAESSMNRSPHLVGGRSDDAELTDLGRAQARDLGRALRSLDGRTPIAAAWASPAVRTVHTAALALGALARPVTLRLTEDLHELAQGPAEGRPRTEVYTPAVLERIAREGMDFALPGGESMNQVAVRMEAACARILHETRRPETDAGRTVRETMPQTGGERDGPPEPSTPRTTGGGAELEAPEGDGGPVVAVFTHGFAIRCLAARIAEPPWTHAGVRAHTLENVASAVVGGRVDGPRVPVRWRLAAFGLSPQELAGTSGVR